MRHLIALLALICDVPTPREIAHGTSVEWSVYDADWIGIGTIVEAKSGESDGFYVWEESTLRVTETLKGPKKDDLKFASRLIGTGEKPSLWKKEGCEILLFLSEGKRLRDNDKKYANHEWAFLTVEQSAFRLDRPPLQPMFDTAFAAYKTKKDILSATRAALRTMQAVKPESLRVPVPWPSPAYDALYGGSAVYLAIPLDTSIEIRAREWFGGKDEELATSAVAILGRFRSEENLATVKKALSDSRSWTENAGGKHPRKVYPVRREAVRVLKEWKVEFSEPVVEEPVRNR